MGRKGVTLMTGCSSNLHFFLPKSLEYPCGLLLENLSIGIRVRRRKGILDKIERKEEAGVRDVIRIMWDRRSCPFVSLSLILPSDRKFLDFYHHHPWTDWRQEGLVPAVETLKWWRKVNEGELERETDEASWKRDKVETWGSCSNNKEKKDDERLKNPVWPSLPDFSSHCIHFILQSLSNSASSVPMKTWVVTEEQSRPCHLTTYYW